MFLDDHMLFDHDGNGAGGNGNGGGPKYVTTEQLQQFGRNLVQELRGGGHNFTQPAAGGGSRATTSEKVQARLLANQQKKLDEQAATIDSLNERMQRFEQAATDASNARKEQQQATVLADRIASAVDAELKLMEQDGYNFASEDLRNHVYDNVFARIVANSQIDFSKDEEIAAAAKQLFVLERQTMAPAMPAHQFSQLGTTTNATAVRMTQAATGNELVDKHRDNPVAFAAASRAVQQFEAVAATMPPGMLTLEKFVEMAIEDPQLVEVDGDPHLNVD